MGTWPKLTPDWLDQQVGKGQPRFLRERLHSSLFGEAARDGEIDFRLAPSIVSRSECELFAVSAPRFAVRAKLKNGSFVNIRRLGFLRSTVENWGSPLEQSHPDLRHDHDRGVDERPAHLLLVAENSGRCMADSVLVPPAHLAKTYHVVKASLGRAYGESLSADDEIEGVPFVQHIRLGGGMCAQAVAFAATTLLHEYANRVCGVCEISALACVDDLAAEATIPLGGLTSSQICNYFADVGLSCLLQEAPPTRLFASGSENVGWLHNALAQRALQAYLMSDMPVVFLTDVRYMRSIYDRIGFPGPQDMDRLANHAVLIVGCQHEPGFTFLMNDPASLPLIKVDFAELMDARPDVSIEGPNGKWILERGPVALGPVTPNAVKLPLLDAVEPHRTIGLFLWSAFLRERILGGMAAPEPLRDALVDGRPYYDPGNFRLVVVDSPGGEKRKRRGAALDEGVVKCLDQLAGQQSLNGWFWLQRRCGGDKGSRFESVIVWDATQAFKPGLAAWLGPVRAVLHRNKEEPWTVAWTAGDRSENVVQTAPSEAAPATATLDRGSPGSADAGEKPLTTALISSFAATSLAECACHGIWPPEIAWCDVYSLMQNESFLGPGQTAVGYMASNADNGDAILETARHIHECCSRVNLKTSALASFIPTLSFPWEDKRAQEARFCLCFLHRLAVTLSRLQDVPVKAIEIVGGSRVTGIWPAEDLTNQRLGTRVDRRTYAASVLSDANACSNILDNLSRVAKEVVHERSVDVSPMFAVELEPGPLFAIRDWPTLSGFCTRLQSEAYNGLSEIVGVNIDIAHWNLAGVHPSQVVEHEPVFSAIVHAHISGSHRCAHFGDIAPLCLNQESDFDDWLTVIRRRAQRAGRPSFSGVIAIELEATKGPDFLRAAVKDTYDLLARRELPV